MSVRAYVPATFDLLARFHEDGEVPTAGAVEAADESEEAEYAALEEAADVSSTLLEEPGRRVVLVAEVDDEDGIVALRDVVAVHADVDESGELAWFATQEIGGLLS